MGAIHIQLIDEAGHLLATAEVVKDGAVFAGTIDLRSAPPELCALFAEFEECVNDQVFTLADEIQGKIAAFPIKAVFPDGAQAEVGDLQVFPTAGDVSFKLAQKPALATKSA